MLRRTVYPPVTAMQKARALIRKLALQRLLRPATHVYTAKPDPIRTPEQQAATMEAAQAKRARKAAWRLECRDRAQDGIDDAYYAI